MNRKRPRYSDAEVNFIREAYLLDGKTREWIREQLPRPCCLNMVWRIAVGRAYPAAPLSARLIAAAAAGEAPAAEVAAPEAAAEELLSEESGDWA